MKVSSAFSATNSTILSIVLRHFMILSTILLHWTQLFFCYSELSHFFASAQPFYDVASPFATYSIF
jgi:hypothetical protein